MLAAEESSQSWPTNNEKCQDIDTKSNDNRASSDSSETDEPDNDEYDSDAIDSEWGGEKVESGDLILVFINSDEEDANDRPNATRSG